MSPIRFRRPLQFMSVCAVAASLGGCAAVPLAQLAATQMMQPAATQQVTQMSQPMRPSPPMQMVSTRQMSSQIPGKPCPQDASAAYVPGCDMTSLAAQPASPMLSMFQGWGDSLQKMTGTTATR
jgi:hypothetical protein